MSSAPTVLVSGGNGFVASWILRELVASGYPVRATVRSQAKADDWNKANPDIRGKIEWTIVEDIEKEGAFDEALKGISCFLHTSSPFVTSVADAEKDLLAPALNGTKRALESAAKTPSVTRVVLTSSFASVINLDVENPNRPDFTYDDTIWNPATAESALKNASNGSYVYCASKTIAERAAWQFVEEHKPAFTLVTLLPPMVIGPITHSVKSLDQLNTSTAEISKLFDAHEVGPTTFPVLVDVRDLARAHVQAIERPNAAGKRFLLVAHHFSNEQNVHILKKAFPELAGRLPDVENKPPPPHYKTDSSKAEKELGFSPRSHEETIRDAGASILQLEKQLKA